MRRTLFLSSLLALSLNFSLAGGASAEDPANGRLPDGRAYRTDKEGNQLVDYIAELELNVDALNRRIMGLEDEVQDRNQQIERLKTGGTAEATMAERDLLAKSAKAAGTEAGQCPPSDCTHAAAAKSAEVEQRLITVRDTLNEERQTSAERNAQCESTIRELRSQVASGNRSQGDCAAQTTAVRADLENSHAELERLKRENITAVRVREDLERTQAELAAQRSQTALLTQKVAMLTEQQHAVNTAPKPELAPLEQTSAERASMRIGSTAPVRELSRTVEASSLDSSRERALDGMRGGYQSELNQLRDQIATRDRLFSTYDQSRTAVKFRPSPAVSSRGLTPAQIASQIKSASAVYQLSLLKRDIQEIRAKVSDDIALMNRMKSAKR